MTNFILCKNKQAGGKNVTKPHAMRPDRLLTRTYLMLLCDQNAGSQTA